ncbi:MAG TPA: diguanylate cyclase [Actinomycetota bacterium]|nr:diguanylate cyclase [Actinomycetota bacterium]
MSFRARLTLFFIGIVVVPLGVSTVVVNRISQAQALQRTDSELIGTAGTLERAIGVQKARVIEVVQGSGGHPGIGTKAYRVATSSGSIADRTARLSALRSESGLDYLVVFDHGHVAGASVMRGDFVPGVTVSPQTLGDQDQSSGLVLGGRVTVVDRPSSFIVGGTYVDRTFLETAVGTPAQAISEGIVVAATGDLPRPPSHLVTDEPFDVGSVRRGLFVPTGPSPTSGIVLVMNVRASDPLGDLSAAVLAVIAAGILLATILSYLLARLLSRPLEQLTEEAVAATPAGTELAGGPDDLARLGAALGAIRERLRTTVAELDESRGELRRGLERLGETLSATHDLDELLEVVLEAAAATLDAETGAVFLRSGRTKRLLAHASYGLGSPSELQMGEGVAGASAAGGRPVLAADDGVAELSQKEPERNTAMAVPLSRDEQVIGALALYGRSTGAMFSEEDLDTLASFAEQMSVAIENVYLHEETERLSFTDSLTGIWNRRYLELTLNEETQRGQRFGRPYSVLMLDIDRFKKVNDRFGHGRGDQVLGELTDRISGSVRAHIDTLARFGGEEFVVVLPETAREGAMAAAEKIRQLIRGTPFTRGGDPIKVTISIGVATFPDDGRQPQDLIRAADRALYEAKRGGRDRVVGHVK